MTMFAGVMAGALIFSAQDLRATIFGVLLWSVSLYLLRLMAKADPQMLQVYLRHRRYKRYYPARSTPFRENSPSQTRGYQ